MHSHDKKDTVPSTEPDLSALMSEQTVEVTAPPGDTPHKYLVKLIGEVGTGTIESFESGPDTFFMTEIPGDQKAFGAKVSQAFAQNKVNAYDAMFDQEIPPKFVQKLLEFLLNAPINRGTLRPGGQVMSELIMWKEVNDAVKHIRYHLMNPTLEFFKDPGAVLQKERERKGEVEKLISQVPEGIFEDDFCFAQISKSERPPHITEENWPNYQYCVGRVGIELTGLNKYVSEVLKPAHPEWNAAELDALFKPQRATIINTLSLNQYCAAELRKAIEAGTAGEIIKSDMVAETPDAKTIKGKFSGMAPFPKDEKIIVTGPKPVVIFDIDTSCSMEGVRLNRVIETIISYVQYHRDRNIDIDIAIVDFACTGAVMVPKQSILHRTGEDTLLKEVRKLKVRGGTNLPAGNDMVVEELKKCRENGIKTIFTLTDGDTDWVVRKDLLPAEFQQKYQNSQLLDSRTYGDGCIQIDKNDYFTSVVIKLMRIFPDLSSCYFNFGFIDGTPAHAEFLQAFSKVLKAGGAHSKVDAFEADAIQRRVEESIVHVPILKVPVYYEVRGKDKVHLKDVAAGKNFYIEHEFTRDQLIAGVKLIVNDTPSKERKLQDVHQEIVDPSEIATKQQTEAQEFLTTIGVKADHVSVIQKQKDIKAKMEEYESKGMKVASSELKKYVKPDPVTHAWLVLAGELARTEVTARKPRYLKRTRQRADVVDVDAVADADAQQQAALGAVNAAPQPVQQQSSQPAAPTVNAAQSAPQQAAQQASEVKAKAPAEKKDGWNALKKLVQENAAMSIAPQAVLFTSRSTDRKDEAPQQALQQETRQAAAAASKSEPVKRVRYIKRCKR